MPRPYVRSAQTPAKRYHASLIAMGCTPPPGFSSPIKSPSSRKASRGSSPDRMRLTSSSVTSRAASDDWHVCFQRSRGLARIGLATADNAIWRAHSANLSPESIPEIPGEATSQAKQRVNNRVWNRNYRSRVPIRADLTCRG